MVRLFDRQFEFIRYEIDCGPMHCKFNTIIECTSLSPSNAPDWESLSLIKQWAELEQTMFNQCLIFV